MSHPDPDNEADAEEAGVSDRHVLLSALGNHPKTKILTVFLDRPDMDFNVTEVADYADLERDTVYKYLDTLRGWGLVEQTRKIGNSQMYSLNTESEAAETFSKFEWMLVDHLATKEKQGETDDDNNPLP